jgi:hypothetical protein
MNRESIALIHYSEDPRRRTNLAHTTCHAWEGNEGSGIIRVRHTKKLYVDRTARWGKKKQMMIFFGILVKMLMFFIEGYKRCICA